MTPDDAARIVLLARLDWPGFIRQLSTLASCFDEEWFPVALADALRTQPELIRRWNDWSKDQRWTPSAAVQKRVVAWVEPDGQPRNVVRHTDEATAVVDFLHRLSVWVARRQIIIVAD